MYAEESAHFALLEHPDPRRILLIGGGGILRLTGDNWGGLEHCNSNVSNVPATSFRPEKQYRRRVLGLLCHEFFHLWNIKRLRPLELGPFDYDREVYTTMLWLAEGVTNYYDCSRSIFSLGYGLALADPLPPFDFDGYWQFQVLHPRTHERRVAAGAAQDADVETSGLIFAAGAAATVRF